MPLMLRQAAAGSKAKLPLFKIERPCPPLNADGSVPPALPADEWTTWTHEDFLADVQTAAKALIKLGFEEFDTVNVWGYNAPEWFISAIAANFAGGKVGGLYPTDMPDTAAYKIVHSGGSVVVVEDAVKISKIEQALIKRESETGSVAKRIKAFVAWGYEPQKGATVKVAGCNDVPLLGWKSFLEMGKAGDDAAVASRCQTVQAGHCAALIYTSGTTGDPKAVMISHDNIIFESSCILTLLGDSVGMANAEGGQERILSYLPLSHVAGMMLDVVTPIICGALKPAHTTIFFARPYDLKAGSIKDRLQAARPTLFLGVPLVWEKIADKIRAIGAANTGAKKAIGDWSKSVALTHSKNCNLGGNGAAPAGHCIANAVLGKVKEGLGLDKCKFGFTGAAPIRVDTLEYFGSLGLLINEAYGMSECTGACTWSLDEAHQWGSCGWEMPGVEVKAFRVDEVDVNKKTVCPRAPSLDALDEQYQGELCFRGRNIMMGYLAQPDMGNAHVEEINKKTAETIDAEGWLHSGDKGMVTAQGMVKITGRYKELIITDGGENIAPVPIEDHVKRECDGLAEVMMVGDKRKYNVVLCTLKAKGANGEVPGTDDLDAGAARLNPDVRTISGAMKDKMWIDAITAAIQSANSNGKICPNNSFKIQKFTILPTNFSEENNELTPTKKLKRKIAETRYAKVIDNMYATSGKDVYIEYSE